MCIRDRKGRVFRYDTKHDRFVLVYKLPESEVKGRGMSVSDIEEEMREIYEIELSTSAISIITNRCV